MFQPQGASPVSSPVMSGQPMQQNSVALSTINSPHQAQYGRAVGETQEERGLKEQYARKQKLKAGKLREKRSCWQWIQENFVGTGALADSHEIYKHAGKDVVEANLRVLQEDEDGLTEEDKDAISEHQSLHDIPLLAGRKLLVHRLGQGVAWYFVFLQYLWLVNLMLGIVGLVSFLPHLAQLSSDPQSERPSGVQIAYVSNYSPKTRSLWFASSIFALVIFFCIGPIYNFYVRRDRRKRLDGGDYIEDPFEGSYNVDSDECIDLIDYEFKKPPTRAQRAFRRTVSLSIFATILVAQGFVSYYSSAYLKKRNASNATTSTVIGFIVKGAIVMFKSICRYLTIFERHSHWSSYRRWECFKLFIFRVCNVLVLYFVKHLETLQQPGECQLESMASQFFSLIWIDISVNSVKELIFPILQNIICKKRYEMSKKANDESKPMFTLSDEYVEVVYRQFVVGMGFFVFPLIPFMALAGNIIEYVFDKFRMLRIARKPRRTNNTFQNILVLFFFIISLSNLVAFPNGAVWILTGKGILDTSTCKIYSKESV